VVSRIKSAKRFVRFVLVRSLVWCCARFPIAWVATWGACLGTLVGRLARGERAKALRSLSLAFPMMSEDDKQELLRRVFSHAGRMVGELVCYRQLDADSSWVHFDVEQRRILDAALARRKGVIFISAHLGNWELLARHISLLGYPCQTIAREASDARTTKMIEGMRESAHLKSIWRGSYSAAKDMLKALRRGEILGLLIDQDTKVQSVFVPFFGTLAKTPRGAADLVLKTGAVPLMGFAIRMPHGKYKIFLEEIAGENWLKPVRTSENTSPRQDTEPAAVLTALMTQKIEDKIRAFPEQWMWMHERWKSRPA
jgi:Kdo2-lipid IVA lauroyltransferase/acyltransferase